MRQALVVGWVAFAGLAWAASPAHFWLDSGELAAAGYELGVMHPPGAPGYGLLLRAATALPLGSLGFRMAVLSSAMAAACVALVHAILVGRGTERWVAWGACLWMLGSWTFVRHGRIVEIYALEALLLLVTLWGFDPRQPPAGQTGRRWAGTFAAVWGAWAFGDLRLALVPLVVLAWAAAARRREPWARFAPAVVVAASFVALALPLASARMPVSDWGDPETMRTFLDHVFARSIREAYVHEILPSAWPMWRHNADAWLGVLVEDLGPLGPVALALGLLGLWLPIHGEPSARSVAVALTWLVFVFVLYAVGINPMGIADRQTSLVLMPLAALVVAEQMRRSFLGRPNWRFAVGPLVWVILLVPTHGIGWDDGLTTRSWAPHAWARAALADLPPRTLVLTQSDDLSAALVAARTLEGARPDVVHLVGQHLASPVPDAAARDPEVAALWRLAATRTGEAERIQAVVDAWPGPVAIEGPATEVFSGVPFWSPTMSGPLRVRAAEVSRPASTLLDHVDAWLERWPRPEDRARLGTALANDARAVVRLEGDWSRAARMLERVVRDIDPASASSWVALGALRDRMGDPAVAVAMTDHALRLEPDRSAALLNLALYLSRHSETRADAIVLAERAVALRPHEPAGWRRLAQVRAAAGDLEGAAEAESRLSSF